MSPTIKRTTIEVTLLQGDDSIAAEELLAKVERAIELDERPARSLRLVDDAPASLTDAAMREYNEFMDGAAERGATLTVTALRGREYRAILANHPPREGNLRDQQAGLNWDTIGDDLAPPSVTDQFATMAERDEFLEDLNHANQRRLVAACVHANQGGGVDPKARLSLPPAQTSGETSEQPERLA